MPPSLLTIPTFLPFADSLAAALVERHRHSPLALARGLILLPNHRAARTMQEAFVRESGGALLLPRLVAIGDPELGDEAASALDPLEGEILPPAVEPVERLMMLTRLVQEEVSVGAAEALRLAQALALAQDQLTVEEIEPKRLLDFAADLPDLSLHWEKSLDQLRLIIQAWPERLREKGRIDLADRRNRLLRAVARRWECEPPADLVCAAGITTSAPAVARLLRAIARAPTGMVVLPGLDLAMPDPQWESLGPHPRGEEGRPRPSIETHPQFHLKLLLERMGFHRSEVELWPHGGRKPRQQDRARAISHSLAPASFTDEWLDLEPRERRLPGLTGLQASTQAEEAQLVALLLRRALEQPGRTAALVTPDRALARRVASHLRRWGIEADDSAGRPLSETPPGAFLLALARAAADRFAPVSLLSLLKHPLTMAGEGRLAWLDGVRQLDLALRGPRPAPGLEGVSLHLAHRGDVGDGPRRRAGHWWSAAKRLLEPLETAFASHSDFGGLLRALRESALQLAGEGLWSGTAGRAAAELFASLEETASAGPEPVTVAELPVLLELFMRTQAVRPPFGQHPRVFIWGLLEARLQKADVMVLSGLNEGVWPALPAPDPWMAPRLRSDLGLPSLERRIGLAAHDFISAAAAADKVYITRSRRDSRAPTTASRFWLRLEALTGGLREERDWLDWTRALDRPAHARPVDRPAPCPTRRPERISVTDVDRLKADPFAFYARKILGLSSLDPVDAEPSAAWRGSAVHRVLEQWMKEDDCDPERLRPRAEALLADAATHALTRAFWQPRLIEAIDFIANEMHRNRASGRHPKVAEQKGEVRIAGITLSGVADRIDRCADGSLVIVDYKTGKPPSNKAVTYGFSLQLGLLGLIAEAGGFGLEGRVSGFEYWSLAKGRDGIGHVASPVRAFAEPREFTEAARQNFVESAARWLTGAEPFTAKLHPEFAPYGEYDQLMRLDEWYGRDG